MRRHVLVPSHSDQHRSHQPEGTPLGGAALSVDVAAIERELASLWRSESSNKALTRACSWNLVVHCSDPDAAMRAKAVADTLVRAVPTRTILVTNEPDVVRAPELEARVSANCHIGPGGGKLLCTEEVHLEARGKGVDHIPSLVSALLVPDVPTALWWTGDPPEHAPVFLRMLSGVDRVIVDTAGHVDARGAIRPSHALRKLAHVTGLLDGVVVTDLNWLRMASLRSALASLFDAPAGHLPLYHLRRLTLQVHERGLNAARLLVAWFASRLKWTEQDVVVRPSGLSFHLLSRDEEPIDVDVDVVSDGARDSGIVSVVLETSAGARFGVHEKGASLLEVDAPGAPRREVNAPEPPIEQLLVAALGLRGRDRLLSAVLHRALQLEGPARP
jgi:glucose-6-phosphate dehydrogenase assembly protein OpcA